MRSSSSDLWSKEMLFTTARSEEHTSELQSLRHLVCRLLLEKKNCSQALASSHVLIVPQSVNQYSMRKTSVQHIECTLSNIVKFACLLRNMMNIQYLDATRG